MKRGIILIAAAIQFILSGCGDILTVTVSNPLEVDRQTELVEIPLTEVYAALGVADNDKFVVRNGKEEVQYQLTHDGKVVFPVTLSANQTQTFTLRKGTPVEFTSKVRGDHYPNRIDDICWENDLVGFRVYGYKEDKASGYDIFTKRNTDLPVIPEMYRKALDPEMKKRQKEIGKEFGRDGDGASRSLRHGIPSDRRRTDRHPRSVQHRIRRPAERHRVHSPPDDAAAENADRRSRCRARPHLPQHRIGRRGFRLLFLLHDRRPLYRLTEKM